MKSESIKNITAALCKVQSQIKDAQTDAVNPHFKSSYTTLAGVLSTIRKPLAAEGLAITQTLDVADGHAILVTSLLHVSGEWIEGRMILNPVKNDPQGIKSAVTYARRTSLTAIVGIAEEDDDANIASTKEVPRQAITQGLTGQGPAIGTPPKIMPLNVGHTTSGFIIPFGKFQGKSIDDVPLNELQDYVSYLQKSAAKDKKPMNKNAEQLAIMVAEKARKSIGHNNGKGDDFQAHAQEDIPF